MSNATVPRSKPVPIFPVPVGLAPKTPEENLAALAPLCHVVEAKDGYALVHASPAGVARIASELGLEAFPSRKGGEYYAVKVGKARSVDEPARRSPAPRAVPQASLLPEAWQGPSTRTTVDPVSGTSVLVINGQDYIVRETTPKRRMDRQRWEVRRDGELVQEPYVVTFQNADGTECQCGCKDWIYRRRQCKHIRAIQAAFGRSSQRQAFAS